MPASSVTAGVRSPRPVPSVLSADGAGCGWLGDDRERLVAEVGRQVRRLANDSAGLGQAGPVGVDPLADGGVVAVAGGAATGGGLGRLARGRTWDVDTCYLTLITEIGFGWV